MSPPQEHYSRYREPSNAYGSDFAPDQSYHRFPAKYVDVDDDADGGYFTPSGGGGRSQHYADSDQKSHPFTGRSHTSSSAKRSRKTSSSTARELVRALLNERLEADTSGEVQLARAYDIIRAESRRAADAERIALESAERLKGLAFSRVAAQKDAARAQAELRAYKLQLENAQRQLEEANAIMAASDAERVRAERAVSRMRRTVEKFREGELARRAREQGFKEGRREALWSMGVAPVPSQTRSSPRTRGPVYEDEDEDEALQTPTSNVPLPVPPPASVPIMSRRVATPTPRRSTPIQQDWQPPPVPEVIRQQTTPPSRRASTPSWQLPVPPPASIPVLPRRGETPRPGSRRSGTPGPRQVHPSPSDYDDFESIQDPRERNPVPDHIIIRSPIPMHATPQTPPVSQPVHPTRPASSQATRPTHINYPPEHPQNQHRRAKHYSVDDPAALASASANRIYSQYATSSGSSASEPVRPPSRGARRRHGLPQPETIVPRPATGSNHRFEPPVRPPSASSSIPASAAAFARQRNRHTSSSSASTTSSPRTETTFPAPSRIAQLQRQSLGDRRWSAESGSSVPGITIEPPSRPESVDTIHPGVAFPSHLSPFGPPEPPLVPQNAPSPAWGMQPPHSQPQMQPQRPPSRTGFMYGPLGPTSPHSPAPTQGMNPPPINFGAPPPPGMPSVQPPARPGSAADYFGRDHHGNRHSLGRRQGRHRREPAGGESAEDLGMGMGMGMRDPNAFHDPDTDPSLDDEEEQAREFGRGSERERERSTTPRAHVVDPYAFDERRAGFDERRGVGVGGSGVSRPRSATPASTSGSAAGIRGFIPPRPSTPAGQGGSQTPIYEEDIGFDSPHRVPLPIPSSASASASRAASSSKGGRSRKTSLLNGGISARFAEGPAMGTGTGRPASRTAFGNTPFVRSSGLYEED